jgi:hypothetical protein
VRSVVHHLLVYSDGLAFGVKVWTASSTTSISRSVYYYTLPPSGTVRKLVEILFLISDHGAFLKSNLYSVTRSGVAMSNVVSIALWSDPCSVSCITHFNIVNASSSDASIKSIVVSDLPRFHVLVPLGSRLQRE